jgi:flagellar hook protein FlgE
MDVSFGTVGQSDGLTSLNGTTFDMRDIGADGKGSGKFVGLTWDKNGYGTITYSNQTTEIVCRVPIVKFRSMNSLTEGSSGVFYSSEASGPYTLSFPQADIIPSALEESTASATDTYVAMARDGKRFSACLSGLGKTLNMLGELQELLKHA